MNQARQLDEAVSFFDLKSGKQSALNITSLDVIGLIRAVRNHGNVVIQGASVNRERFEQVTESFTKSFVQEPARRKNTETGESAVDNWGEDTKINLHSESSFSPSWPNIISFFSEAEDPVPTDFADATTIWNSLHPATKNFFCTTPVTYKCALDLSGWNRKLPSGRRQLPSSAPGVYDIVLDGEKKVMLAKVCRHTICELPDGQYAFSNHLFHFPSEPQILSMTTTDGDEYPIDKHQEEVNQLYREVSRPFYWKQNTIMIVDNRKLIHGRLSTMPIASKTRLLVRSTLRLKV
jgi:alpha-ketoglutarate-dependent taurine dioxygenase